MRLSSPECATGQSAGMLPVVNDDLAVHDHVVDAYGIMFWVTQYGVGSHRVGVENHDVRLKPSRSTPRSGKPNR